MKNICHTKLIQLISEVARTQGHDSTAILKQMVKIMPIFGSCRFSRVAQHDIFSLSDHFPASWNLYIARDLGEWKRKCSSSHQVQCLDDPVHKWNHRKPESLLRVLNLVRPLTVLCRKLNEELKEKQKAKKKEGE